MEPTAPRANAPRLIAFALEAGDTLRLIVFCRTEVVLDSATADFEAAQGPIAQVSSSHPGANSPFGWRADSRIPRKERLQEFARRSAAEGLDRPQSAKTKDSRPRFSGVGFDRRSLPLA